MYNRHSQRVHYRSTPCLAPSMSSVATTAAATSPSSTTHKVITFGGRNEYDEKYHDLRDQHAQLRREAKQAQDEVRLMHTKLARLMAEKRKYYRGNGGGGCGSSKSERELALEEKIYDLEQKQIKLGQLNERLQDKVQLLRVRAVGGGDFGGCGRQRTGSAPMIQPSPVINSGKYHWSGRRISQPQLRASSANPSSGSGQRSLQTAYANVPSKVDSGLKPSSVMQRSRSHGDLRTSSSASMNLDGYHRRSNGNLVEEEEEEEAEEESVTDRSSSCLSTMDAKSLMQEAKEEIIRLETIIAQQQRQIQVQNHYNHREQTSTSTTTPTSTSPPTRPQSSPPASRRSHQTFSYTITASTSSDHQPRTSSLVPSTSNGNGANGSLMSTIHRGDDDEEYDDHSSSPSSSIMQLWSEYQQILMHKESASRISTDLRTLIDRLHSTVQVDRRTIKVLKNKLSNLEGLSAGLWNGNIEREK